MEKMSPVPLFSNFSHLDACILSGELRTVVLVQKFPLPVPSAQIGNSINMLL